MTSSNNMLRRSMTPPLFTKCHAKSRSAGQLELAFLLLLGSIFDSHKRRAVRRLMYIRLASLTIEAGFLSAHPDCNLSLHRIGSAADQLS